MSPNADSGGHLTIEMLRAVAEKVRRDSEDRMRAHAQDMAHFWESVPAHLRDHPLIAEMSMLVGSIVHPKVRDQYQARYEALIKASHNGRSGADQ